MRIVGINSSPRKQRSRTLKLVEAVLEGGKTRGADTELIEVCSLNIQYCIGCQVCCAEGRCVHEDDFAALLDAMVHADGVVFGSPVYMYGVSAQLKAVIDRMEEPVYRQVLAGKYGCSVVTAGSAGYEGVLRYLNCMLNQLGALTVGGLAVRLDENIEALEGARSEAFTLGQTLAEAIRTNRRYPDQDRTIEKNRDRIRRFITANKESWPHIYELWVEKGWM
ncbi:MAG: flavodoxin family protein [Euryarchaeota archaeon]|nr:flavodoxin family protein [Euryarchaeota archaeon]